MSEPESDREEIIAASEAIRLVGAGLFNDSTDSKVMVAEIAIAAIAASDKVREKKQPPNRGSESRRGEPSQAKRMLGSKPWRVLDYGKGRFGICDVNSYVFVFQDIYQNGLATIETLVRAFNETAPPPSPVPEGFVLVPVEPTKERIAAGQKEYHENGFWFDRIYRAMTFAASPASPAPVGETSNMLRRVNFFIERAKGTQYEEAREDGLFGEGLALAKEFIAFLISAPAQSDTVREVVEIAQDFLKHFEHWSDQRLGDIIGDPNQAPASFVLSQGGTRHIAASIIRFRYALGDGDAR